jgi:hypothetical protein
LQRQSAIEKLHAHEQRIYGGGQMGPGRRLGRPETTQNWNHWGGITAHLRGPRRVVRKLEYYN